jgi:hypothetical protein
MWLEKMRHMDDFANGGTKVPIRLKDGTLISIAGFERALFSSTRTGNENLVLFPRQFKNSISLVRVLKPPSTARCCELSALTYTELKY